MSGREAIFAAVVIGGSLISGAIGTRLVLWLLGIA